MNEDVRITLPMTATRFSFTADYLEKKRASGLEYMLLKMIGYGEETSADLKISDVLSIFSVSLDLLPFIIGEIRQLEERNMVRVETEGLSKNTSIKRIKIRPEARPFYDSGFVTDRNGNAYEVDITGSQSRRLQEGMQGTLISLEKDTNQLFFFDVN